MYNQPDLPHPYRAEDRRPSEVWALLNSGRAAGQRQRDIIFDDEGLVNGRVGECNATQLFFPTLLSDLFCASGDNPTPYSKPSPK
jgi:hypothetical protein